jgi:hypothetical protein
MISLFVVPEVLAKRIFSASKVGMFQHLGATLIVLSLSLAIASGTDIFALLAGSGISCS